MEKPSDALTRQLYAIACQAVLSKLDHIPRYNDSELSTDGAAREIKRDAIWLTKLLLEGLAEMLTTDQPPESPAPK